MDGTRKARPDLDETPGFAERSASEPAVESPRLNTSRDEPTRADAEPGTEPTDVELERGILDAMRIGLVDVARTLATRLEGRRALGNVVDLAAERAKRQ